MAGFDVAEDLCYLLQLVARWHCGVEETVVGE
jgi:hypothetical protein